jgi:hypothetical protein
VTYSELGALWRKVKVLTFQRGETLSRSRCARLGDAAMRNFSLENFPFKLVPFKVVIRSLAAMRVKGLGEVVRKVSW